MITICPGCGAPIYFSSAAVRLGESHPCGKCDLQVRVDDLGRAMPAGEELHEEQSEASSDSPTVADPPKSSASEPTLRISEDLPPSSSMGAALARASFELALGVAPTPETDHQAPAPETDHEAPAPETDHQAPAPETDHEAPAPETDHQAPAPKTTLPVEVPAPLGAPPPAPTISEAPEKPDYDGVDAHVLEALGLVSTSAIARGALQEVEAAQAARIEAEAARARANEAAAARAVAAEASARASEGKAAAEQAIAKATALQAAAQKAKEEAEVAREQAVREAQKAKEEAAAEAAEALTAAQREREQAAAEAALQLSAARRSMEQASEAQEAAQQAAEDAAALRASAERAAMEAAARASMAETAAAQRLAEAKTAAERAAREAEGARLAAERTAAEQEIVLRRVTGEHAAAMQAALENASAEQRASLQAALTTTGEQVLADRGADPAWLTRLRMRRTPRYLIAVVAGILLGSGVVATDYVFQERERKIVATFRRANALVREGKPDDAVYLYRQLIRDQPDFDLAYRHLGVALAELGRHQEARAAYLSYLQRTNDEDDAARVRALLE